MTDRNADHPPFDVFSLADHMRKRFGWSPDDMSLAMEQLMPAAMSGFRHFGDAATGMPDFAAIAKGGKMASANPAALFASLLKSPTDTGLNPFFGPEAVQTAVANQIAAATGLQQDAIQEMMPVAATLATGQILRPFLQGEARNLLDAYLRGFARGRPKPAPTPADYLQGYTEAVQAFWGAFLKPMPPTDTTPMDDAEADVPEPDEEVAPEPAPETSTSEFDRMVTDWMAAGRDLQSNQFRMFDNFFANAADKKGQDK